MSECREKFANEFMAKLDGKMSPEQMKVVLQELQVFVNDYEIENRKTDIVPYSDQIPECYRVYMVAKKIEGLSEETLKTYNYYLQDFFLNIGKPLREITANDIRVYLYDCQKRTGIKNRTLDGKRLVINTFMEWCSEEGYIEKNPCAQIHPIKYEAKPREPLSGIEMELIRDACNTYREKAIVEMFYSTGCRVSELSRLKKEDVNFQTGEVHLFGKGHKHRTSYLNAKAEVSLKKYLFTRKDNESALFVTERKPYRALKKESIESIIKKIGVRSGIERNLYPHLIRHTTATDALERGMNVAEVQKILGHEKLNTTMIYAKVSQENVRHSHRRYIV